MVWNIALVGMSVWVTVVSVTFPLRVCRIIDACFGAWEGPDRHRGCLPLGSMGLPKPLMFNGAWACSMGAASCCIGRLVAISSVVPRLSALPAGSVPPLWMSRRSVVERICGVIGVGDFVALPHNVTVWS